VSFELLLLLLVVLAGGDVRPKRGARVMLIDALSALLTHTTHTRTYDSVTGARAVLLYNE